MEAGFQIAQLVNNMVSQIISLVLYKWICFKNPLPNVSRRQWDNTPDCADDSCSLHGRCIYREHQHQIISSGHSSSLYFWQLSFLCWLQSRLVNVIAEDSYFVLASIKYIQSLIHWWMTSQMKSWGTDLAYCQTVAVSGRCAGIWIWLSHRNMVDTPWHTGDMNLLRSNESLPATPLDPGTVFALSSGTWPRENY